MIGFQFKHLFFCAFISLNFSTTYKKFSLFITLTEKQLGLIFLDKAKFFWCLQLILILNLSFSLHNLKLGNVK